MTSTTGAQANASWVERSTQIRIVLGEFCLGHVRFRGATLTGLDWRRPIEIDEEAIERHLQSGAEVVYLASLPTTERLPRLCFRKHWVRYVPARIGRHYIDLEGTFQDYLRSFAAKQRNNLTRPVRRFIEASEGTVDFREYRHPDDMSAFYEAASPVTVKTFQHRLLKSGLPQSDDFRRKLLELAELDKFRGYVLFHDKSPIAFGYCLSQNDILTYQVSGYDPDFRQYSPGTLLLYYMLERVFAERRFRIFDFGTGDAFYKSFFSTGVAPCAVVYHFAYTPKNLAFLGAHLAAWLISTAIVKTLSALGIRDFVKKAFRRVG